MMKKKLNRIGQKVLSKLLVLLGFSCTFVFMACYGPKPQSFNEADFEAYNDSLAEAMDSTIMKEVPAEGAAIAEGEN